MSAGGSWFLETQLSELKSRLPRIGAAPLRQRHFWWNMRRLLLSSGPWLQAICIALYAMPPTAIACTCVCCGEQRAHLACRSWQHAVPGTAVGWHVTLHTVFCLLAHGWCQR